MSETPRGYGDANVNPSGGILKKFKDRKSKEQPVLGAMEAFGSLIYKVNTQDQAEMYVRTTEKLSEYVLTTYGKDMRNLVKYTTERKFTEPEFPSRVLRETDRLHEVKYKESLAKYHRELDTYNDQKTKVFGVILGQCSPMVKDRLAKNSAFAKVEMDSDVIALNKHDTIQNYYLRFKSQANVLEAQWGSFFPPNMVDSDLQDDELEDRKKEAQEAILTAIFVSNADNGRFRALKDRLNNDYLSGNNNYPTSLEQAVNLLTYNQDFGARVARMEDKDFETAKNFAQKKNKARKAKEKENDTADDATPSRRRTNASQSAGWSA
jgi:hypothetical protein